MSPRDLGLTASDEAEDPELYKPLAKGLCSPFGSCRPVHPAGLSTQQYTGSRSPHRCDVPHSRANHTAASQAVTSDKKWGIPNSFIHSLQRNKQSCQRSNSSVVSMHHCSHVPSIDSSTTTHMPGRISNCNTGCTWGNNTNMLSAPHHAPYDSTAVHALHTWKQHYHKQSYKLEQEFLYTCWLL